MANQPHIERVVKEKESLDEKRAKLAAFFKDPIFATLALPDQELLQTQADVMTHYSDILALRLARFPK